MQQQSAPQVQGGMNVGDIDAESSAPPVSARSQGFHSATNPHPSVGAGPRSGTTEYRTASAPAAHANLRANMFGEDDSSDENDDRAQPQSRGARGPGAMQQTVSRQQLGRSIVGEDSGDDDDDDDVERAVSQVSGAAPKVSVGRGRGVGRGATISGGNSLLSR